MTPLSAEQQEAVSLPLTGRSVVTAAPGSGKTRTLVARVEHMIANGITPGSIAVITFTTAAARQLKEKLPKGIGHIGTIHSFALRIVRDNMQTAYGIPGDKLVVLSEEEAEIEFVAAARACTKKGPTKKLKHDVDMIAAGRAVDDPDAQATWKMYWSILSAELAVSLNVVVHEATRVLDMMRLRGNPIEKFQHLLIDESQDTDAAQFKLVDSLRPISIFAVGDIRQAIYGWRGADPGIMRELALCAGAQHKSLTQCFRVSPRLASIANAIGAKMGDGDISGEIVGMSEWDSYGLLMNYDAAVFFINEGIEQHGAENVCVLSRNHAELEIMKERLDQAGIKCQHVRPPSSLLRSKEMRFVLATLSLSGNRNDWRAATVLHLATGGDPAIVKHGSMEGLTIPSEITGELTQEQAIEFAKSTGLDHRTLDACDNFLLKVRYENGLGSREVPEFLAINRHGDSVTKPEPGAVTLRTVHGAKGLEWDCVAVIGMEDGNWPSKTSVKDGREDEERRLAYVAVTRARKMLVVCRPMVASEYVSDMQSKMQGE